MSSPSTVYDYLPIPKHWRRLLVGAALYFALRELSFKFREKKLKGEVAVITGAGSGIGRLLAVRLAKNGAKLALWDINEPGVNETAEIVRKLGVEARTYVCDVSDRNAVYAAADKVVADFGTVGILINNAGIVSGKKLLEASDALMEKTLQVNTIALLWTTKAFLPSMLKKDKGHIVTVASSAGRLGVPGMVDYCASKFGAVGFDESLRMELRRIGSNVKTLCVCPSYIKTGMFKGAEMRPKHDILKPLVNQLMPLLEPEYVADKIIVGMKRNQTVLVMPRFGYLTYLLRALLPTSWIDEICEQLGAAGSMDKFEQTRSHDV